jgi:putative flippase GtrA
VEKRFVIRNKNIKNIIKFSISSLSSFMLDYLLFSLMIFVMTATPVNILIANISARIISAIYNYCMNCKFVFKENRRFRSALDYLLLALFILVLNNILLEYLTQFANLSSYISKLITECTLFVLSWLVQNFIIFRKMRKGGIYNE